MRDMQQKRCFCFFYDQNMNGSATHDLFVCRFAVAYPANFQESQATHVHIRCVSSELWNQRTEMAIQFEIIF